MLTIRTPEGIEFSLHLAGTSSRLLACTIDFFAKMALSIIVRMGVSLMYAVSSDLAVAVSIITYFLISIGYSIVLEWFWRGQTLGKRLLRLRVMDVQGLRMHPSQIIIRNLLRFVDALPICYMVGGLVCLMSSKVQRLGDIAANTIVIRSPKISEPDLNQLLKDKYNSFRPYSHLCARLRNNATPYEAQIAMQALLRRDEFEPSARIALFADVVEYFKEIITFPQEACDGISDEQYVRNIVDILFRDK